MVQLNIKQAVAGLCRARRLAVSGGVAVAVLSVAAWFAPLLLVHSPLWPYLIARVGSSAGVEIQVGHASLSWLAPPRAEQIVMRDGTDTVLARIESLRLDRPLWALCLNSSQLGAVRIQGAEISVEARPDGSNLEDALHRALADGEPRGSRQAAIQVVDGWIRIHDVRTGQQSQVQVRDGAVTLAADGTGQLDLRSCVVQSDSGTGTLRATATWQAGPAGRTWQVQMTPDRLPLAVLTPWAGRWLTELHLAGGLTGSIRGEYETPGGHWTVDAGQIQLTPLQIACRELGPEPLRLDGLTIQGGLDGLDTTWQFRQLAVSCDAGSATVAGQLNWPTEGPGPVWLRALEQLEDSEFRLNGDLDLSVLARILPTLLRVRADTQVESGKLSFELQNQAAESGQHLVTRVTTRDLAAVRNGQAVRWDEPFTATLDAHRGPAGWQVHELACRAEGVQLAGSGTLRQGMVTLECDLDRLLRSLAQWADLSAWQAGGRLHGRWEWQQADGDEVTAHGECQLRDLVIARDEHVIGTAPAVDLTVRAGGRLAEGQVELLRTASLVLQAQGDRLEASLLDPVPNPGPDTVWPLGLTLTGESKSWLARLGGWLPAEVVGSWSGEMGLNATCRLARDRWDVVRSQLQCRPWQWCPATGVVLSEPDLQLTLVGSWYPDRQAGSLQTATLRCTSLAANAANVAVDLSGSGPRLVGSVAYRANLQRIYENWRTPIGAGSWRLHGDASGELSVVQANGQSQLRWSCNVAQASLMRAANRALPRAGTVIPASRGSATDSWQAVWQEPQLQCSGSGYYQADSQTVHLARLELQAADQVNLTAEGTLAPLGGQPQVDVQGQIRYDLGPLSARLCRASGIALQASGRETQSFRLRGPLTDPVLSDTSVSAGAFAESAGIARPPVPPGLTAECGFSWQSLELLGLVSGPGLLEVRLAEGTLAANVNDIPLSQGRLQAAARLQLNTDPILLAIDRGPVLRDVQITPAMCHRWLKYVAPLAANAARAEGRFSLTLNQVQLEPARPESWDVRGSLAIERGRVGPSPLAQRLLGIAGNVRALVQRKAPTGAPLGSSTWLTLPNQELRVAFRDGRVVHNELTLVVDDLTIRTRGSVGLDETLSLTVAIPIQRSWIAANSPAASLGGEVVELQVRGTLENPDPDVRALARFSKHMLQRAAGRLLLDEFERALLEPTPPLR